MNITLKTLTCAFVLSTATAPAFADAHADLNSMTCEEYNQLNGVERDKIAAMAIAEVGVGGSAESAEGEGDTEQNRATDSDEAGSDMTEFEERLGILNRTCARHWDAMLMEAVVGSGGTGN